MFFKFKKKSCEHRLGFNNPIRGSFLIFAALNFIKSYYVDAMFYEIQFENYIYP